MAISSFWIRLTRPILDPTRNECPGFGYEPDPKRPWKCSALLLWIFWPIYSWASEQQSHSRSPALHPFLDPLHFIQGPLLIPIPGLQFPVVDTRLFFHGFIHVSSVLTWGPCLLGLGWGLLSNFGCQ